MEFGLFSGCLSPWTHVPFYFGSESIFHPSNPDLPFRSRSSSLSRVRTQRTLIFLKNKEHKDEAVKSVVDSQPLRGDVEFRNIPRWGRGREEREKMR